MTFIRLDYAGIKYPPSKKVLEKLSNVIININEYPSGDYSRAKEKIAQYCGVSKENILITNGADEAIDLITRVFGKKVLIPVPTFSQFELAAKRAKSEITLKNCLNNKNYEVNFYENELSNATLIWICNPNNPTGSLIQRNKIIEIIEKTDGIVAVDECYFEYSGETVVDLIDKYQNLIIVRSFSKSFGLAGLRVGYIISNENVIKKIEEIRQMFNVNTIAETAIIAVLDDRRYYEEIREKIKLAREEFKKFLESRGFYVFDSFANFILVDFKTDKIANYVYSELKKNNIVVLPPNDNEFSGLANNFVRFSIATEEEMNVVMKRLGKILKNVQNNFNVNKFK